MLSPDPMVKTPTPRNQAHCIFSRPPYHHHPLSPSLPSPGSQDRASFLLQSVADLRSRLRALGSDLILRWGAAASLDHVPLASTVPLSATFCCILPSLPIVCFDPLDEASMPFS